MADAVFKKTAQENNKLRMNLEKISSEILRQTSVNGFFSREINHWRQYHMLHLYFFHNLWSYKLISDTSSYKFHENCIIHRKTLPDTICDPLPVKEGEFLYTSFNLTRLLNSIPWMVRIYNSCTEVESRFVCSILDALAIPERLFSNFIFLFLYPWLTYVFLPMHSGNFLSSVVPTTHLKSLPSKNNPLNMTYTSFVSKSVLYICLKWKA